MQAALVLHRHALGQAVSEVAELVQAARYFARVATSLRQLLLEVVDLLQDVDGDDHIVVGEVEHGARIVEQDVRVEDEGLPHLSELVGITDGAPVAA